MATGVVQLDGELPASCLCSSRGRSVRCRVPALLGMPVDEIQEHYLEKAGLGEER